MKLYRAHFRIRSAAGLDDEFICFNARNLADAKEEGRRIACRDTSPEFKHFFMGIKEIPAEPCAA